MDRVSSANYATVGGLRMFVDPNLGTNTNGTSVDQVWLNGVQESILAPVTALGLAPTDADNTQLYQVIRALAGSTLIGISTAGSTTLTRLHAGVIEVNATVGNVVIDLPAPTGDGVVYRYEFLRIDGTANTVTVTTPTATIIDEPASAASIQLPPSSFTRLICDSLNYIQDGPYVGPSGLAAYALLNGSSAETFNVANATALTHAVPLAQVQAPARLSQYASNGTFLVPAGITELLVSGCAGGAGGNPSFSGGAGQPVIEYPIAVTPGHTLAITIGSAGTGGTPSATAGGPTVLTDTTTSTVLLNLLGATGGSGGSIGFPNGSGFSSGTTMPGASGPFGGGGGSGGTNSGTSGQNAAGYGAGGGQGQTAAGGNGAPGYLRLRF